MEFVELTCQSSYEPHQRRILIRPEAVIDIQEMTYYHPEKNSRVLGTQITWQTRGHDAHSATVEQGIDEVIAILRITKIQRI